MTDQQPRGHDPIDGRGPGLFGGERTRRQKLGAGLREEGARGALIATISTVVFLAVALALVVNSPNWPKVRDQFFNPSDFRDAWPKVLQGFWVDMQMFAYGLVAIPILALLLATARSFRGPAFFPIRLLAIVFIDVLRGIPLILLILLLGFGLPALQLSGLPDGAMFWGVTALTLSYGAYTAEIIRSGIGAVPESQRASARAIGLTQLQALRYAIFPQAIRNVVPAIMNTVVSLQKDVALVSVLGVREAVREAQIITARSFNYTAYVAATVLFLAVSIPLVRIVDHFSQRDRARRMQVAQ
jgi:polar amino acid transport system permease protein